MCDWRPIVCVLSKGVTFFSVIILAFSSIALAAENIPAIKITDIISTKTYDKVKTPTNLTHVNVHLTVLSLDSFDETSMSYSVSLLLAQSWTEPRLQNIPRPRTNITDERKIIIDGIEYLWTPDLYFKNAKDSSIQTVPVPNQYIWLYPNKVIVYLLKAYVTASCDMDFKAYPHDTQICHLKMESLSYLTDEVIIQWHEYVPLVVNENIVLPELQLLQSSHGDCTEIYSIGNMSCLEVSFKLSRNVGYFIFHVYIPLYFIIFLSWISFWAPREAALARISLGGTCLLAAAALLARCYSLGPHVIQITAIEVFTSICTLFAFLALVEYFLVLIFRGDVYHKSSSGLRDVAAKIDWISRIFFPFFFVIFNMIYWIMIAAL